VDATIDESKIFTSGLVTDNQDGTATLTYCIRVDLLSNGVSMSFKETNIAIAIDLSAGFSPVSITLSTVGPGTTGGNAGLDKTVTSTHCGGGSQSAPVDLCIKTVTAGTKIVSVDSVTCTQKNNNEVFSPIPVDPKVTSISGLGTPTAKVTTKFPPHFYTPSPPAVVTCTGMVTLGLLRRRLGQEEAEAETAEAADTALFEVQVQISSECDDLFCFLATMLVSLIRSIISFFTLGLFGR